ncbi:DNA polymerase/3'-5' exonuclease PolX [bacterium]|nr:MAG: DNA polymerase/3'-5' exonuclease PolX [bacterium]
MNNRELSSTFKLIADLLEIKGENIYKILAYRRASESLSNLPQEAADLWKAGELDNIPGVGKAIAEKIDELLRSGHLGFLEKLTTEVPASLADLLRVPEVGPKKAALFWKNLGIIDLAGLEAAARTGKLNGLPGVGEKSEARILAGIEALGRRSGRTPLGQALPFAREIVAWLRAQPGISAAEMAGSLRRMKATIGDLDFSAATLTPDEVMEAFVSYPRVIRVIGRGSTKASVEFDNGLRAQLWLHPPAEYGTALLYATGSKEHSVRLREIAQKKDLSLSDHSLKHPDGTESFYADETSIYAALGLKWIPPEIREDRGEIEASRKDKLPNLIERKDLLAEFHIHSTWSDGQASIRKMAEAAMQRGLKVLAITDHSASLGVAGGLSIDELARQREEIDTVQKELGDGIRLLQGAEVEIKADGSLDYPDDALERLDIVIASLHTSLRQPREQVTRRVLSAIQNPHVDILGHPTGRLIPDREGADLDMDEVFKGAKASGVALEINAHPSRMDLEDIYARQAAGMGIPITVNTDAHHPDQLDLIEYGLGMARRAWLEPQQVINAWPVQKILSWLEKRENGN